MERPPKRRIEIDVVEHEGELLFKTEDLLFDQLETEYDFLEGELSIYRGGKLYDKTSHIFVIGTHAAHPAFCGLSQRGKRTGLPEFQLASQSFQAGDKLCLDIFVSE